MILFVCLLGIGLAQGQTCGSKPAQRPWATQITGGRDADRGSWPWQLSLRYNADGEAPFTHTCGAVLVSPNWALTAAHCIDPEISGPERDDPANFRVVAGAYEMDLGGTEQVIGVTELIRHNRYVADSTIGFPNDIGLLRLASSVDTTPAEVGFGCVPVNSTHLFDGNTNCWMSGWGLVDFWDGVLPDVLQEGHVMTLTNDECADYFPFPFRETHQCVYRGDGGPVACSGDSGGPLHCLDPDDGKWYVTGITSFGVLGCEGTPSMYTRVAPFGDWIRDRINAP